MGIYRWDSIVYERGCLYISAWDKGFCIIGVWGVWHWHRQLGWKALLYARLALFKESTYQFSFVHIMLFRNAGFFHLLLGMLLHRSSHGKRFTKVAPTPVVFCCHRTIRSFIDVNRFCISLRTSFHDSSSLWR